MDSKIEAYLVGELEGVRVYSDGYAEVDVRLSDGTVETVLLTPDGYAEFLKQHRLEELPFDSSDFGSDDTLPEGLSLRRNDRLKN
jgi:hypothetical protein